MSSSGKTAGAVGGKTARACDSCMRRRARWYCAADDAFLCQGCDTSVHSANPLARRHERLRLRASSPAPTPRTSVAPGTAPSKRQPVAPAWSKRKARTRRPPVKSVGQLLSRRLVVPELAVESSSEERKAEEEEEGQLLYSVPIFDPALAEFCSPPPIYDAADTPSSCFKDQDAVDGAVEDTKYSAVASSPVQELPDSFVNYGPTDAELREFAADMEALLGQGLDDSNELDDSFYMDTLGLMAPVEEGRRVKMENDGIVSNRRGALLEQQASHDFNCRSWAPADDDDGSDQKSSASNNNAGADARFFQKSLDLRLNYEVIIESWGSLPWTDGGRPLVQLDDILPNHHHHHWGGQGTGTAATPRPRKDGEREARVTRYREKRRTRLFAKKIRYEVRKMNAEKRPRMKGRFVKRPAGEGGAVASRCVVS